MPQTCYTWLQKTVVLLALIIIQSSCQQSKGLSMNQDNLPTSSRSSGLESGVAAVASTDPSPDYELANNRKPRIAPPSALLHRVSQTSLEALLKDENVKAGFAEFYKREHFINAFKRAYYVKYRITNNRKEIGQAVTGALKEYIDNKYPSSSGSSRQERRKQFLDDYGFTLNANFFPKAPQTSARQKRKSSSRGNTPRSRTSSSNHQTAQPAKRARKSLGYTTENKRVEASIEQRWQDLCRGEQLSGCKLARLGKKLLSAKRSRDKAPYQKALFSLVEELADRADHLDVLLFSVIGKWSCANDQERLRRTLLQLKCLSAYKAIQKMGYESPNKGLKSKARTLLKKAKKQVNPQSSNAAVANISKEIVELVKDLEADNRSIARASNVASPRLAHDSKDAADIPLQWALSSSHYVQQQDREPMSYPEEALRNDAMLRLSPISPARLGHADSPMTHVEGEALAALLGSPPNINVLNNPSHTFPGAPMIAELGESPLLLSIADRARFEHPFGTL